MRVIGAGFGRTGTTSMKAALEQLGFDPCYHMDEAIIPRPGANEGHLETWHAFAFGQQDIDWATFLAGYDACVDFPTCIYYRELMSAFPEAKVVLNTRDPERWYASWHNIWSVIEETNVPEQIVRYRLFYPMVDELLKNRLFKGRMDKDSCISLFNEHIAAVKDYVPADRLLVFEVKEGWKPLCEFLDVDVPGTPFPHLNESEGLLEVFKLFFWTNDPIEL